MVNPVTDRAQTRVGIIGVGEMGGTMVHRLLSGGRQVVIYDTRPSIMKPFVEAGARSAASAGDLARDCDVVIACLPSSAACVAVAGEVAAQRSPCTYLEMSTIGLETVQKIETLLAPAGIGVVDAPVSGGIKRMLEGDAAIVVSAPPEILVRARPILEEISVNITLAGDKVGAAQTCKLVNNAISFSAFVVSCEALAVGVKAGVPAETLLDFINNGSGRNSATVDKIPRAIIPRTFRGGGSLGTVPKDLNLYLEVARKAGMPELMVAKTVSVWQEAIDTLGAEVDYTHMIEMMEQHVGVAVSSAK